MNEEEREVVRTRLGGYKKNDEFTSYPIHFMGDYEKGPVGTVTIKDELKSRALDWELLMTLDGQTGEIMGFVAVVRPGLRQAHNTPEE